MLQNFNILSNENIEILVYLGKHKISLIINFKPYQSKLIKIDEIGTVTFVCIFFISKIPQVIPGEKPQKERWEVRKTIN